MGCLLLFIVFSSLPLILSVSLFFITVTFYLRDDIFHTSFRNEVEFKPSNVVQYQQETYHLTSTVLMFSSYVVILKFEGGYTYFLWRDSCVESEYRLLLVRLRAKNKEAN
ncbi:protein YgfX [Vibrio profundi]|uniref:protein YgfX n=1 Tax=Vibrio profundi TaxID=1774960 RepID=UPI00373683BF